MNNTNLKIVSEDEWSKKREELGSRIQYVNLIDGNFLSTAILEQSDTSPDYAYSNIYIRQSHAEQYLSKLV